MSLIMINSYMTLPPSEALPAKFQVFGKLAAKPIILSDLEHITLRPPSSALFVIKEIDSLESGDAANRLRMRASSAHQNVPSVEKAAILSIEMTDRQLKIASSALPSVAMRGIRIVTGEGGDWPHIARPEAVAEYIVGHLKEFGSPLD
jgi:hypothetical protein